MTSFGAAAIGEHLYVVGGYAGVPHQYSMEGQSRAVGRIDMRNGAYEELSPLPYGVQSVARGEVAGLVAEHDNISFW